MALELAVGVNNHRAPALLHVLLRISKSFLAKDERLRQSYEIRMDLSSIIDLRITANESFHEHHLQVETQLQGQCPQSKETNRSCPLSLENVILSVSSCPPTNNVVFKQETGPNVNEPG